MFNTYQTLPHGRIQDFFQGGPGQTARKQSEVFSFFSPQLILQFTEGVQWFYYRKNYTFPRIQRGSNMLISIETHITCDFPRGSGPLSSPLDPHMCQYFLSADYFCFKHVYSNAHQNKCTVDVNTMNHDQTAHIVYNTVCEPHRHHSILSLSKTQLL